MSLRLASPIPDHVMMGARAAIWAAAAAWKVAASTGRVSRTDLDEGLHDLAVLRAHLDRGAVKVWSSEFFPAVIDAFPFSIDVEFDSRTQTHPWKYFVTTAPLRVLGPDFELSPRGEVPAEAVEAALRELSRPLAPGTIIGSYASIPHPPSPEHIRVAREVLRRLSTTYMEEISRLRPAVADAIRTRKWITVVDLYTDNCEIGIKEVVGYHEGISVYMRRGSLDIYPIREVEA